MIDQLKRIGIEAGKRIMEIYSDDFSVELKGDQSPLTKADMASHHYIVEALSGLEPKLPVISEESAEIPHEVRSKWDRFWLVDPLDGTKEFVKKTGEFTVNIAMIDSGKAVMGLVYAPAIQLMYWAERDRGAVKQDKSPSAQAIKTRVPDTQRLSIVASRDHAGPQVQELIDRNPNAIIKSMGSSLKFCLVAEGQADVYLRDVPTMEWDTAAAQCVLEAAGGCVRDLENRCLTYNKISLKNPCLIALGDPNLRWS